MSVFYAHKHQKKLPTAVFSLKNEKEVVIKVKRGFEPLLCALTHTLHRGLSPSRDADRLPNSVSSLLCLHPLQYFILIKIVALNTSICFQNGFEFVLKCISVEVIYPHSLLPYHRDQPHSRDHPAIETIRPSGP